MKRILLASVAILLTLNLSGQYVSLSYVASDLLFTIHGGKVRIEPIKWLYIEGYASYRPLKLRSYDTYFGGAFTRRGRVLDGSLGVITPRGFIGEKWQASIGPFIQHKKFTDGRTCDDIPYDCRHDVPERIDAIFAGGRFGLTYHANRYIVVGFDIGMGDELNAPSIEEIEQIKREEKVNREFYLIAAHARLSVGIQLDWRKKEGGNNE